MRVKDSLDRLTKKDTLSLVMFALFQFHQIPEMATLSSLVYLFDEDTTLKFIKYFGGQTITIPSTEDFEDMIYALSLYNKVCIQNLSYEESISEIPRKNKERTLELFNSLKSLMENYQIV